MKPANEPADEDEDDDALPLLLPLSAEKPGKLNSISLTDANSSFMVESVEADADNAEDAEEEEEDGFADPAPRRALPLPMASPGRLRPVRVEIESAEFGGTGELVYEHILTRRE